MGIEDAATQEKFNALQLALSQASTAFSNNVLDATKDYR